MLDAGAPAPAPAWEAHNARSVEVTRDRDNIVKVVKKLGEMQHVKFALDDWEDWRRVVSVSLEAAPAVEEEELVVVDTTSKGGKWAKAGGGPKRRR